MNDEPRTIKNITEHQMIDLTHEQEWKQAHEKMAAANPCGSQCRHPFDCYEKRRCGWPLDVPYSEVPARSSSGIEEELTR